MRVDPKQKGGKRIQVTPQDVTTAGAAEAWMRAVQTTPADFLKLKFAIQATHRRRPRGAAHEAPARHRVAGLVRPLAARGRRSRARADRAERTIDPPRVVVGQRTTLRIDVLAPNYMTSPPEMPGLPASQRRDATAAERQHFPSSGTASSYAGVRFEFAIYPQEPGSFAISEQKVKIKYAAEPPATREAVLCACPRILCRLHSRRRGRPEPLLRRAAT